MKRKLLPLSGITRNDAALYAQQLINDEAVVWLYILTGEYFEFTYHDSEYPNAVRPAVDQYFRVTDTAPIIRALMQFTIDGKYCRVYPGKLEDENGEQLEVTLDEIRYDKHGIASYEVNPEGNPELVSFSLAQFSLELIKQPEHVSEAPENRSVSKDPFDWDAFRKDNCNISILTYLQNCDAENQPPTPEMCWEFAKENALDYRENWMIFPIIRFPEKETKKVYRENFNRRYQRLLIAHNRQK